MRLRTGLKVLIGLSVLGVAVALLLTFTCPFAGQIAFSTLVRQVPMEHPAGAGEPSQQHWVEVKKPHGGVQKHKKEKEEHHEAAQGQVIEKPHEAVTEHREERKGLTVHLMVIPHVRTYPVKETKLFGLEVSLLGILVLLLLIALCFLLLGQRPLRLLGYTVTLRAMGITVVLINLWNLIFAAFLLGVEVVQFKEL